MNPVKVKAVLDSLTIEDVMRELEGRYDEVLCHQPKTNYKNWKRVTIKREDWCYRILDEASVRHGLPMCNIPHDAAIRVRGDELIWKEEGCGEWTFKFVVQSSLRLETFFGLLVEN